MNRPWAIALLGLLLLGFSQHERTVAGERLKLEVVSTADKTKQTCYLIVPEKYEHQTAPVPLLVALHTWSGGVEQRRLEREQLAEERGWLYLSPDFRGPNNRPAACGSPVAMQDILDAVAYVKQHYRVDARRVYLTGTSGGGHMTLQMVAKHPDVWAAASAWVGISDLATWHRFHAMKKSKYDDMLRKCCGGAPGENAEADQQYHARSPVFFLGRAKKVPVDIAAGVHDGYSGSVPVRHSLEAFNAIAQACGGQPVSEEEIVQISRPEGRLKNPREGDEMFDPIFDRRIYLRRSACKSRVTIFEGGHEGIPAAAIDWLARHSQPVADE